MRPALLVAALAVPLLACESEKPISTTVSWMEWPADVQAATPFRVRMVVYWPCAAEGFRVRSDVDPQAVTLRPSFARQRTDVACIAAAPQVTDFVVASLDTAGYGPALRVSARRAFDMRAETEANGIVPLVLSATNAFSSFGYVMIHPRTDPLPVEPIRNAGGKVRVEVDEAGCVRIRLGGAFGPNATVAIDNPADTIGISGTFVRGYIYQPAAPICGESRAFHLVRYGMLDVSRQAAP